MQLNLLVLSYVAAAVVSVGVATAAWRRRRLPGAGVLALLMVAVGWWLLANALEAAAIDRQMKVAWSVVAYPGIESAPVLFLVFALRWTHQDAWLTPRWVALLLLVPVLSVGVAATNEWHGILWPSVSLVEAWGVTAVYAHGPWFWIELGYAYVLIAAGFVALFVALYRHPAFYSRRARVAMTASLVPVLASGAYAAGLDESLHADTSSIAFALTGLVAAWGILRSGALDPVPVAWASLVDMLPDAVLVVGPEGRLAAVNPSATRMLAIGPRALGRPIDEVLAAFPSLLDVTSRMQGTETEICADGRASGQSAGHDLAAPPDDRWFNVRLSVISDDRGRDLGRMLVVRDVTERRRMIETIRQLSLTDELTGLLNRRGFMTLAEQEVRAANRRRDRAWLLFADVDRLKEINDRLGHEAGDRALREIAQLLRTTVFREADIVARYGGDEFAVLATETGPSDADALVERIDEAMRETGEAAGRPFELSLSVGAVAIDPAYPATLEELICEADRRMYQAKRSRPVRTAEQDASLEVAS